MSVLFRFFCGPCYSVFFCGLFFRGLEAARDVESEVDVVRVAAARELTQSRAEGVREIQLQGVATRALFNCNTPLGAVRIVAVEARRVLASDVTGAREPQPASESSEPCVLMVRVFVLF